jgi:5-methylcytosine-specific restriction enzyme subunit McrC
LNEHYRNAHDLAWLLLDGLGTKDVLASGMTHCFAFLIDMNRLFEKFVYRLVDRLFAATGMHVHYQRDDRSIILNASTNRPYAKVVPDLVIETKDIRPSVRIAVDAKYKLYDERKLDSGDIYQTFLYAFAYSGTRSMLPVALLIYPSSTPSVKSTRLRIQTAQALAGAEILTLGLPIPVVLAEVTQDIQGPATTALIEAIHQGMGGSTHLAAAQSRYSA